MITVQKQLFSVSKRYTLHESCGVEYRVIGSTVFTGIVTQDVIKKIFWYVLWYFTTKAVKTAGFGPALAGKAGSATNPRGGIRFKRS